MNLPLGAAALLASRRQLVESRAPGRRMLPDVAGAVLLALGVGALTLGIVQGQTWGWTSSATVGALASGVVLIGVFARRCARHRSPVVDTALLRIRSVATANVLTLVGAAGFYSYVLANVLFLTAVWHYSVLEAGLAITPGPFVAAAVARPAAAFAARIGAGPVIALGGLVWGAGVLMLIEFVGVEPDYMKQFLPTMIVLGIGAGIAFPTVGGAGVAEAPGGRFATATGLNAVARQLGAAIGVALLVAIIGHPSPEKLPAAFDRGWSLAVGCFAVVALGGLVVGRVRPPAPDADADATPGGDGWPTSPSPDDAPQVPAPAEPAAAPSPPAGAAGAAEVLAGLTLFRHLGSEQLELLSAQTTERRLHAGELLFEQGDEADAIFVLATGRLEVMRDGGLLRTLGPGSVVGELALLASSRRSATIRARRDSRLLELRRKRFDWLLEASPEFARALLRETGAQLQASRAIDGGTPPPDTTLAVLCADPGVPVDVVLEGLTRELAADGPVTRVDGFGGADRAAEAERLERIEADHAHVLLVARDSGPWADFALAQADRVVVLVGDGPLPARDHGLPRGAELIVVTADAERAVPAWVAALEPRARHVVDAHAPAAGLARAGRRLARRSLGLVLSGGGARGFAAIGVLDELERAGLVVDRVAGCSMGAFIAALVARGADGDAVDAWCYEEWVRRSPLGDYTLPRHSLIRGERATQLVRRALPGSIEALPLDFYCVSADLRAGELVVHRRGSLAEAVRASSSLPGLAPARALDGRLLVDGAVLNRLPVGPMADSAEGPILAVDTGSTLTEAAAASGDGGVETRPTLVETLTRSVMLGSATEALADAARADLVITPGDEGVGLFEFHQLDRMREAGRRAAAAALEAGRERLMGVRRS